MHRQGTGEKLRKREIRIGFAVVGKMLVAAVLVGVLAVPAAAPAKAPKLAGNYEGAIADPRSPFEVSFTINKKNRVVEPIFPMGLSAYTCANGFLPPIFNWESVYKSVLLSVKPKRPVIFGTSNTLEFYPPGSSGFSFSWNVIATLHVRGSLVKKGKFKGWILVSFKWADPFGLISPCGTEYDEDSGSTLIRWTAKKK
jgi:hypothetical protein